MATLINLRCDFVGDDDPDISFLQRPEFKDRLAAYNSGEFFFVGVRAVAVIRYDGDHEMRSGQVTLHSGGVWGVEDDSDAAHFDEIYREELLTLRAMLDELGVSYTEAQFQHADGS
jgi:hypothetical protein